MIATSPIPMKGKPKASGNSLALSISLDKIEHATDEIGGDSISPKTAQQTNSSMMSLKIQIDNYLRSASGQLVPESTFMIDHDYCKPFHTHPDPQIQAYAAKFLFMKNFPSHIKNTRTSNDSEIIDVVSFEEPKKIPFLTPKSSNGAIAIDEDIPEISTEITNTWTCEMNRLWTRATKILYSDRIACLSFKRHANEALLIRNLQEQTANKFRELFASTFWNMKLVVWLHNTLIEHTNESYKTIYVESLKILKHKIPSLIDSFYSTKVENKAKPFLNDPLFNTLSHYKLTKLIKKPIFIIVPSGPNQNIQLIPRLRYWYSLFNQMGKVITIPVVAKPSDYVSDILTEIRCLVNEKVHHCRTSFSNRPVILVGFHHGSLIAAHCALQCGRSVCAIVCLGFPLKGINGVRGELDDPILELSTPVQFIIGENSMMTSLDDIEDFRERMTKSITSLIVVGGADDRLVVSNTKKRLDCLTQSMVDRCVANEIYSFLSYLLHHTFDFKFGADLPLSTSLKKKVNRKRPIDLNDPDDLSGHQKVTPKRKRPSTSTKALKVPNTPDSIQSDSISSIPCTPVGSLVFNKQNLLYPNVATALNDPKNPEKTINVDFLKTNIGSIKVDKSKMVISDQAISFSLQPLKKPAKKSLGNNAINISLTSALSPIKEEKSPSKTIGLIPLVDAITPMSTSPIKIIKTETKEAEMSTSPNSKASTQQATIIASTPLNIDRTINSIQKDSYTVSEIALIHQSSTRTGRQIKPPKSLDF